MLFTDTGRTDGRFDFNIFFLVWRTHKSGILATSRVRRFYFSIYQLDLSTFLLSRPGNEFFSVENSPFFREALHNFSCTTCEGYSVHYSSGRMPIAVRRFYFSIYQLDLSTFLLSRPGNEFFFSIIFIYSRINVMVISDYIHCTLEITCISLNYNWHYGITTL